jgi:predicted dienelactone hydrolase
MRSPTIALALLCLTPALAQAVGIGFVEIPADGAGPAIGATVWSPCAAPNGEVSLGRLTLPGVRDCPIAGERLPLVVVSHGRGGWFGGHHDTAEALAEAGFVAALNHPGDTAGDLGRTNEPAIWLERPASVTRLIDFMLGAWPDAARLDPARVGFFGFSRGAYTGLALVGGRVNFAGVAARCAAGTSSGGICEGLRAGGVPPLRRTHDPRLKVAVVADPVTFLFGPEDLRAVTVPVQLWSSERGGAGVIPEAVAALKDRLPSADYRLVPNSAHFAFLAPCSPRQAAALPEFCTDGPGFDRIACHKELNAEVLAFLREHLGPGPEAREASSDGAGDLSARPAPFR